MATSPEFTAYVLEQLEPLCPVEARKMFGGVGLYADEGIFAILSSDDVLYFKVDDGNRQDYLAAEMEQFLNMPYYQLPVDVLEEPDALRVWLQKSLDVARRAPRKKRR